MTGRTVGVPENEWLFLERMNFDSGQCRILGEIRNEILLKLLTCCAVAVLLRKKISRTELLKVRGSLRGKMNLMLIVESWKEKSFFIRTSAVGESTKNRIDSPS